MIKYILVVLLLTTSIASSTSIVDIQCNMTSEEISELVTISGYPDIAGNITINNVTYEFWKPKHSLNWTFKTV